MRIWHKVLTASAAVVLASACSQEAEAPANQQESADANAMMADPANPYGEAEMQMKERMAAALGANPSETWLRKMIEHHRGAIAMTEVLEAQGGDPQVLEKARMSADKQRKEISELERLLGTGAAAASGGENPYAQAVEQMHQRMMAANGANPSETWMRKMVAHHRGGVDMSNVLLELGGDPRILEKARMTAADQAKEADELERMLQGEQVGAAAATPAAPKATPATAAQASVPQRTEPAAKAKAEVPKAAAKAPAEPAADPHAGHDMNNMSNMSH